ncbi:MAG: ferritin-like protein [Paucimonas sp.]|jgi:rubrerythrin|nr:ferritin-like protein [Paucimonas sp.]
MKESTPMGSNRTGIQMSPFESSKMQAATNQQPREADTQAIAALRGSYIEEADEIGSVPPPATVTGAMSTAFQSLVGNNPKVFIDKLGERLAFERLGTRLYDAFITKLENANEVAGTIDIAQLRQIRDDEAKHFAMVAEAIESVGADPTAETPCADLAGVESLGLVQVITDPRTTVTQSLHAILIAELADQAGWELLIALAEENQQASIAQDFSLALDDEREHLRLVQRWYQEAMLGHPLEAYESQASLPLHH